MPWSQPSVKTTNSGVVCIEHGKDLDTVLPHDIIMCVCVCVCVYICIMLALSHDIHTEGKSGKREGESQGYFKWPLGPNFLFEGRGREFARPSQPSLSA